MIRRLLAGRGLLRRALRRQDPSDTCPHHRVTMRPVIAELRGTGTSDRYHFAGHGRAFCEICGEELGTGDFEAILAARLDIEVRGEELEPPLGENGGAET